MGLRVVPGTPTRLTGVVCVPDPSLGKIETPNGSLLFLQLYGLTSEELVWDENGVLRTPGASTYKLPTLAECPEEFRVSLLPKAPEDGVVLVRGHGSSVLSQTIPVRAVTSRSTSSAEV